MSDWLDNPVTRAIPFSLKGYEGVVSVAYGADPDPARAGFDALPGFPFDLALCRGYPVMEARIARYGGSGYRMLCGWIQLVTGVYTEPGDGGEARTQRHVSVDMAPAFEEVDSPFCVFGMLPRMFDAPALNLGPHAELRWTADTFLTTVPLRSRDEGIQRLVGFRWGYTENNLPDQGPALLPLEVTGPEAWEAHLPFLRSRYPNWRFDEA